MASSSVVKLVENNEKMSFKNSRFDKNLVKKAKDEDYGDKELKVRTSELEDLKTKYKLEYDEKRKLQEQVDELVSSQSTSTERLHHYMDSNERLRMDIKKKTDEIDKLQRNVGNMEDRIRNLEIRASEVEKAELTLESTRKNLEDSRGECRGKISEMKRMKTKLEEAERNFTLVADKNSELEGKLTDLTKQVRQEIIKNESIEKGLELIPRLQEEVNEQRRQLDEFEKELTDKTALLVASKQATREYIDKIREANDKAIETEVLQQNLTLAQHEIDTLKNLMRGKDTMMIQKFQALEQAKVILHKCNQEEQPEDLSKLRTSIDKLTKLIRSDNSPDCKKRQNGTITITPRSKSASVRSRYNVQANNIDVNRTPFSLDNKNNYHSYTHKQPVTAVVYPCVRTNTSQGRLKTYRSSEFRTVKISDRHVNIKTNKSPRQSRQSDCNKYSKTDSLDSESESTYSETVENFTQQQKEVVNNLPAKDKDEILGNIISVGDRVKISLPQKPSRYGHKKVNPINYSGIVKYKGYLDKTSHEASLMIGVRLDEPNGDTQGTINGKNFMYTPLDQGKYFKIRDITSVFDKKTGSYIATEILTVQYANQHRRPSTDEEHYEYSYTSDSNS